MVAHFFWILIASTIFLFEESVKKLSAFSLVFFLLFTLFFSILSLPIHQSKLLFSLSHQDSQELQKFFNEAHKTGNAALVEKIYTEIVNNTQQTQNLYLSTFPQDLPQQKHDYWLYVSQQQPFSTIPTLTLVQTSFQLKDFEETAQFLDIAKFSAPNSAMTKTAEERIHILQK